MKFLTGSETIPAFGVPTKIVLSWVSKKLQFFSCNFYRLIYYNYSHHVKDDEEMVIMFETALLGDAGFGRC